LSFVEKRPGEVVLQVARLPGVLAAEPYREVPVCIRNGSIERRIVISARTRNGDLNRSMDVDLKPVVLPEGGLVISQMLAIRCRNQSNLEFPIPAATGTFNGSCPRAVPLMLRRPESHRCCNAAFLAREVTYIERTEEDRVEV